MRVPFLGALLLAFACFAGATASAAPTFTATAACAADAARDPWAVQFGSAADPHSSLSLQAALAVEAQGTAARRPVPFEYSEGYKTRATIHKYASFATIPLFVARLSRRREPLQQPLQ